MIIPKQRICDFCKQPVGINKRYFIIKSKNYFVSFLGGCSDNKTHDMCEDCMREFKTYLHAKMRGGEDR